MSDHPGRDPLDAASAGPGPPLSSTRVAALVVLVVILLCQALPLAIVGLSHLVRSGTPLVVSLLVLPEYAVTTSCLDHRLRPVPGTYAFDRMLEVAAGAALAFMSAAAARLGRRRRIRWWPTTIVAALPLAFFYGTAALPPGPQTQQVVVVANSIQSIWLSLDGWVMTGDLRPCAQPGVATTAVPVAKAARSCVPTLRPAIATPAAAEAEVRSDGLTQDVETERHRDVTPRTASVSRVPSDSTCITIVFRVEPVRARTQPLARP